MSHLTKCIDFNLQCFLIDHFGCSGEMENVLGILLQSVTAFFYILASYLIVNEIIRYSSRNAHFRGPPGLPVLGNILQLQTNVPEKLRQWSKYYGDVFQIQFGNVPILVVNSAAAAKELFSHQGHALNSRPIFHTFHKVVAKTSGFTIGTSPMSPELKRRRRAAAGALNKPAVSSYGPLLHAETNRLVQEMFLLSNAGKSQINPMPLVRRFALSIILTINWGTSTTSDDESLFKEIMEVEAGIVSTRSTTENPQDYIPLLRLNPFSSRSHQAEKWRERREVYLVRLDAELRQRVEKGSQKPCIQSTAIMDSDAKSSDEDLRTISTSLIQGGTGTISGTVSWALLFLSQHLEIQERSYREIQSTIADPLTGLHEETMMTLDVQQVLPYLHALGQECLRYFTVLRLSLPRQTSQDCTYQGRPIPSRSTIFLNAWACNMDPAIWKDPQDFRPERWFEQPEAPLFTYGMGHRMCAGSALANRELELVLMKVIACFEILPGDGQKPDISPLTGSSNAKEGGRFPKSYEVVFKVRNEQGLKRALGLI